MTHFPLTKVNLENFTAILHEEPKHFGKSILQAMPFYWCPALYKEKAERWYWPSLDGVIPIVENDSAYVEIDD